MSNTVPKPQTVTIFHQLVRYHIPVTITMTTVTSNSIMWKGIRTAESQSFQQDILDRTMFMANEAMGGSSWYSVAVVSVLIELALVLMVGLHSVGGYNFDCVGCCCCRCCCCGRRRRRSSSFVCLVFSYTLLPASLIMLPVSNICGL